MHFTSNVIAFFTTDFIVLEISETLFRVILSVSIIRGGSVPFFRG